MWDAVLLIARGSVWNVPSNNYQRQQNNSLIKCEKTGCQKKLKNESVKKLVGIFETVWYSQLWLCESRRLKMVKQYLFWEIFLEWKWI